MKRLALILVVVLGVAAVPAASAASAAADHQPVKQVDTNTFVGPTGETVSHGLGAVVW
jgi:hypothetical protein